MIDLEYSNGWTNTPEIVIKCRLLKHEIEIKNVSRCVTEYSCEICDYKYKIDSGG